MFGLRRPTGEQAMSEREKLIAEIDEALICGSGMLLGLMLQRARDYLTRDQSQGAQPVADLEFVRGVAKALGYAVAQPAADAPPQNAPAADDGLIAEPRRFACFTMEDGVYEHAQGSHVAYADWARLRDMLELALSRQPSASPAQTAPDDAITGHRMPQTPSTADDGLDWVERLRAQYGRRQAATLRGDYDLVRVCNSWLTIIAADHWHEIIAALSRQPSASPAQTDICSSCGGTGKPTSGRLCMCGGTGRASDAVPYLLGRIYGLEAAQTAGPPLAQSDADFLRYVAKIFDSGNAGNGDSVRLRHIADAMRDDPAQTAGDSIERAEAALSAIADIYNDYFNDACVRHNAAVDAAQTAGEGSEQDVARWAHILQHTTVIECAGWHWERKWDGPLQEVVDLSREVTFIDRARNQEKSK